MSEGIGQVGEQIEKLAIASVKTKILETNVEPDGAYYLVGPDGKAELKTPSPKRHAETLDTPLELAKFLADLVKAEKITNAATFYTETRILAVYDRDDRRDSVAVNLKPSPQYVWLRDAKSVMSQSDIVRTLRITFRGNLGDGSDLVTILRKLKFKADGTAEGDVQHGRESIGRSIVNEVTGLNALPEEIAFSVPVFDNHPFRARIECALEINPADQTFRITAFPQQVKNAMDAALADVEFTLAGNDPKVILPPRFRGQP